MPVNQNRNSIRVLRTTGMGYLAHKNIPNFSVGGGQDFTIQIWVVKSSSPDGFLYGQEGGFSIRLVGGRAVFSLPGCVTLAVDDEWALKLNRHDYIAVRCSGGKYTLFINGIPAAEKTVTAKAAACSGDYYIGKGFVGGFSLVRVSSSARSDQDILSDNAVQPKVDDHCVFQSDCSTVQYIDASANHLPMWPEGPGAGSGIYTACTVFSGDGMISCEPAMALPATHTLLLKLWPLDTDRRRQIYTAMDGEKTIYAVELLPQENGTFKLSVTNSNGAQAVSKKQLLPQLWQDVAAVFDGGKLTLYVDGTQEGVYSLPISGNRSMVVVGSEYESGRPYYEKGFFGYVAYTAEFGRVLPADEIALYADDPPFLFEDGLVSLLPLDWPDEVEAVRATPMRVTGSAPFTMVEGITPRDGAVGVSIRLPTKVSPAWEKLSADDKWALGMLDELMSQVVTKLWGYPVKNRRGGYLPLSEGAPATMMANNSRPFRRLRTTSANPTRIEMQELSVELSSGSGRLSAAYGAVGATTAGAAGAYGAEGTSAVAILGSAVGVALIATVLGLVIDWEKKREKTDGQLTIDALSWNHRGNPANGGIHYHAGGPNLPETMVDRTVPEEKRLKSRCVLVMSELNDLTLDVTLKLSSEATQEKRGTLNVQSVRDAHDLGLGSASADYTVSPGGSTTVSVHLSKDELPQDGLHKVDVVLQFRDGDTFLTNCDCEIYVLSALPIAPWVVGKDQEYSVNEKGYLRLEFADLFLQNIGDCSDFADWAVKKLNESGFKYDKENGACHYSLTDRMQFYLEGFVDDLKDVNAEKEDHILNCSDCAYIVYTACAMVGRRLPVGLLTGFNNGHYYFPCNQIIAVGFTEWKHPFERQGSGGFAYHMFNIVPQDSGTPKVYDACLKVDKGSYPGVDWSAKAAKTAQLPVGMPACETEKSKVAVPTNKAYNGDFYRERLVKDGAICILFPDYCQEVTEFYTDLDQSASRFTPDGYVLRVMEHFALAPTPEERAAMDALPKRTWRLRDIPGTAVEVESMRYESGRLGGPECDVRHWSLDSADEAAERMASTVAYYATPQKYPGQELGVDVGERCVVIAGRTIVFCRLGHVFVVKAGSLDDAVSAARALDKAVNAL